jgi:hypothetical protein
VEARHRDEGRGGREEKQRGERARGSRPHRSYFNLGTALPAILWVRTGRMLPRVSARSLVCKRKGRPHETVNFSWRVTGMKKRPRQGRGLLGMKYFRSSPPSRR